MSADAMVHLHHGRHRALTEAGHCTHCELTVRGGEQKFVGVVAIAVRVLETQPKIQARSLQQIARTARMARRASANADGVLALRLKIEQGIERGNAVDSR